MTVAKRTVTGITVDEGSLAVVRCLAGPRAHCADRTISRLHRGALIGGELVDRAIVVPQDVQRVGPNPSLEVVDWLDDQVGSGLQAQVRATDIRFRRPAAFLPLTAFHNSGRVGWAEGQGH